MRHRIYHDSCASVDVAQSVLYKNNFYLQSEDSNPQRESPLL